MAAAGASEKSVASRPLDPDRCCADRAVFGHCRRRLVNGRTRAPNAGRSLMSESVRVSMIVMLGAGGLFTGGLVWYAWERVWIWRRLDLHEYAVDFRRSVRKADPALPILLVICGVAALRRRHRGSCANAGIRRHRSFRTDSGQFGPRRGADQQPVPTTPGGRCSAGGGAPSPSLATIPSRPHRPRCRCIRVFPSGSVVRLTRRYETWPSASCERTGVSSPRAGAISILGIKSRFTSAAVERASACGCLRRRRFTAPRCQCAASRMSTCRCCDRGQGDGNLSI